MPELNAHRAAVNKLKAEQQVVEATLESASTEYRWAKQLHRASLYAQELIQDAAQATQERIHAEIATLVSRCLTVVFDEPYVFTILFERKRGKTEAKLLFERNGVQVDPMTASGGGIVDVAAFALRLSCLLLSQPSLQRVIVLDEPFKFVSPAESRERLGTLLLTLSAELKIQFIMVTHIEELKIGKVIEL